MCGYNGIGCGKTAPDLPMKIFRGYLTVLTLLVSVVCAAQARNPAAAPPVSLTAADFLTKVYGVFTPRLSDESLSDGCMAMFGTAPVREESGMWLDSDGGYRFSYFGIIVPEVSAVALTEDGSVAGCGYFFLFPYNASTRDDANRQQALFCGNLLQEMSDIGMALSAALHSPEILFAVCGTYLGNSVEMRLSDEPASVEGEGRYVLYMTVRYVPGTVLSSEQGIRPSSNI